MEKKSNAGVVWTVIIVVIIIIIAAIVYYDYNDNSYSAPATTPTTSTAASQGSVSQSSAPMIPFYTVTATTSPSVGAYLAAANGMALYAYSKDKAGVSNCTGACATAWPPYIVSSSAPLTMPTDVTGQLATITRADGTTQLTYNGMPVYFFQGDKILGSVTGNGVGGFSVVKP